MHDNMMFLMQENEQLKQTPNYQQFGIHINELKKVIESKDIFILYSFICNFVIMTIFEYFLFF